MVYLVFKVLVSFDTYILAHQMYKKIFAYFMPQTPRTYARLYKGRQKRHSDCMVDIFHKKGPQKAQLCGFTALCNLPGKGYIGGLDKKENSDSTLFSPTVIHSHSRHIPRPILRSHSAPHHHLPSALTFATILHLPPSPSPLSSHRTTPSNKPHTCAVFRILARNQYRAILLQ